jgi:C1A family cysteine protease
VTPVKDQGQCGSCYAFSVVGAIESQLYFSTINLVMLSEKQIADCTGYGCGGGVRTKCFEYVRDAGGIMLSDDYPYNTDASSCNFDPSRAFANVGGYYAIDKNDEALMSAIQMQGPVSIGITVENGFHSYSGGIYNTDDCPTGSRHAMLAIGFGSDDGNNYWIVKNSWVSSCH